MSIDPALLADVMQRWTDAGIDIRPGVNDAAIERFEKEYGVTLPADVAMYFRTVDGMPESVMDDALIRFWQLAEVLRPPGSTNAGPILLV